ncbi:MAG: pitrilysin family protein [Anaeromyxobacter sp.]
MIALPLTLLLAAAPAAPKAPAAPTAAPAREAPPPPAPPPAFKLPEKRDFTLDNGLQVTLVKVGRMPKATVELSVRIGTGDEAPDQTGMAGFVAKLLLEGTRHRSAADLAAEAARWGGAVETDVTPDETLVGGTVLSEFAPDLVTLVADVALNPAFPARELERVRQDLIRDVSIARTLPQTLAQERFLKVTYPADAYGRLLATPEQLTGYTPEALQAFHATTFLAGRAHLYVAGQFDQAAVEQAIREAFGPWARGAAYSHGMTSPAHRGAVELVDRPGAVQSSLYVGLPSLTPRHPDYLKLVVTNTLLGGYFSSRMTANLREQKGYTYSPRSVLSVRGAAPGYWAQLADVTTPVTGASLTEIFKEVERLRSPPPPAQAEVAAAQAYLAGQFLLLVSDRDGLIDRLRFVALHDLPDTWLEGYVERVRAVTPEEVQQAARTWLDPSRMAVVVVGDLAKVEAQVKAVKRPAAGKASAGPGARDPKLLPRKEPRP